MSEEERGTDPCGSAEGVIQSSSSVVPRVLHLCLSRLTILHPPEPDMTTLMIAIRMRETSRRVLRSPELVLPATPAEQHGLDLDLHFSVQYAHMLNRDTNILQILVQRRKKYKSKPMLGYKTLALCNINMAQVLQRRVTDRVIDLMLALPTKPHSSAGPGLFGQLHVDSLASLPLDVDPSLASRKKPPGQGASASAAAGCGATCAPAAGLASGGAEPSDLVFTDLFSEDEDSEDFESCGPTSAMDHRGRQQKKFLRAMSTGQRHLKQKLAGFMKRFRVNEEGVLGVSEQEDLNRIWEEIEELETNSDGDSDLDFDTISLQSTPRPTLRPFFHDSSGSSSRPVPTVSVSSGLEEAAPVHPPASVTERDSEEEQSVDGSHREASRGVQKRERSGPLRKGRSSERLSWREKKAVSSPPQGPISQPENSAPHYDTTELVTRWIDAPGDALPDRLVLLSRAEPCSRAINEALLAEGFKVIPIYSLNDAKHTMTRLLQRMQKLVRLSCQIQMVLIGGDAHMSSVLRVYVELLSSRSHEWPSHFRFFPVPLLPPALAPSSPVPGPAQLVRSLCHLDPGYAALFGDSGPHESPAPGAASSPTSLPSRLRRYLAQARSCHHFPIGECMLSKGTDDDNSEFFIPFLLGLRIGPCELFLHDAEAAPPPPEAPAVPSESRASPPSSPHLPPASSVPPKEEPSPAPAPTASGANPPAAASSHSSPHGEHLELQMDYWVDNHENKKSLKASIRGLTVTLSGSSGSEAASASASLSLLTVSKEKKQKLQIRLPGGKRPKESELRRDPIDHISRLICRSGRGATNSMKVYVDGDPWLGVKFFQLSPSWQTHTKWFPVATFASGQAPGST